MTIDRRKVLALSGALLAGAAGCLSDDPDDDSTDDGPGNEDDPMLECGNPIEEPYLEFPDLDLVTDPDIAEYSLARQVRGNFEFALELLENLREDHPDENLFFSPYSVSVALAMTYAGARGETAEEMADALNYELEGEDLHAAFGALEGEFERRNEDSQDVESPVDDVDGPAFEFTTANAVWGEEDEPFEEDFLDLLEAYYGAGLQLVNFTGSPEEAREEINAWVEAQTNDRIEDLLPENSITETTRLVLTNAIYFVGMWKYPFEEEATEPGTFTGLDGTETEVSMMSQSIELPYADVDGHQFLELPYANDDTSMVVIVPEDGEFERFEAEFSLEKIATMLEETTRPEVDLRFPKFGIESEFSLVSVMADLGMEQAFGGGADFSGMAEDGGLFIEEIAHKSFVEVDELGTEAAAATAVVMDESAPADHVELTVDRPFLFYIRDRPTETPLFVGRVVDGERLQDGQ